MEGELWFMWGFGIFTLLYSEIKVWQTVSIMTMISHSDDVNRDFEIDLIILKTSLKKHRSSCFKYTSFSLSPSVSLFPFSCLFLSFFPMCFLIYNYSLSGWRVVWRVSVVLESGPNDIVEDCPKTDLSGNQEDWYYGQYSLLVWCWDLKTLG